jgi:hypothetical protein
MSKLIGVCIIGAAVFLGAVVVELARRGAKDPQAPCEACTPKA